MRIAILVFFCGIGPLLIAVPTLGAYWTWWNWQLFNFTRREGLPKARAFWWTLIPFYSYFVLWQQLDGLAQAEAALTGAAATKPGRLIALVCASAAFNVLGNVVNNRALMLSIFLLGAGMLAVYAYLVQSRANSYLAAVHPGAGAAPLTIGEIVAAALGGVAFALVLIGVLFTA
jgi:hypothetical protein